MTDARPHAARDATIEVIRTSLTDAGLDATEAGEGVFVVGLPGESKLTTTCQLIVGDHALSVTAFVCRRPDENNEAVYRWLLGRNIRMFGVAFALDRHGDIFLHGRLSLAAVSGAEIDRLLGAVLAYADESFNTILTLGFASSIRREWDWRRARGEPTRNLDAFRSWLESDG